MAGAPDPLWVTETRGIETLWIEQDCVPSGLNFSTVHAEPITTTSIPLLAIVTHIRVKFTNIFNYFGKINVSDEAMSYFKEIPFKKINMKFSEYKWRVYFYFLVARKTKILFTRVCCFGPDSMSFCKVCWNKYKLRFLMIWGRAKDRGL